jgi:predicted glycoside hydrolase/deacetylase ChbG (UPF0249 family)
VTNLIVNADDFGLTEDINRGIVDGFNNGIITSASLIATMPAFPHAVGLAMENPDLDIGVHLSLTVGRPCSNSTRLAPILKDGEFTRSYLHVIRNIYANRIHMGDVENEISAQITKIREAGLEISHVDSHQHIHMVPCLFKLMVTLIKELQIPFVRIPDELVSTKQLATTKGRGLFVLGLIGRVSRRRLLRAKLNTTDYFWGLSCSEAMSLNDLTHILSSLKPGVNELMCHPGYNDGTLDPVYGSPSFRQKELAALTYRKVSEVIRQSGIQLTNYRKVLSQ